MRGFFVLKFPAKLLCIYILGLYFFGGKNIGKKGAHKMLVKSTHESISRYKVLSWIEPKKN